MAPLKMWIWFSCLSSVNSRQKMALINHFGTLEGIYYADKKEYRDVEGLSARDTDCLVDKSYDTAEKVMEKCERENIHFLTLQDAEYPDRLRNIDVPPCVLYVKGRLPAFDEEAAVTVVGSRRHTAYGGLVAERLSHDLAKGGALIVSGLAKGIDAAAHRGALRAGKATVGVLGCGADIIYPRENEWLFADVEATGAILTEYPPGTPALAGNFPARNRIMSGLSLGVLVVEAPAHSGALITANYALEQGRDVFAVPGNIDIDVNVGANGLIREGAKLVTSAGDVLEEYVNLYPHKITLGRQRTVVSSYAGRRVPAPERGAKVASGAEKYAVRQEPADGEEWKKFLEEGMKDFTDDERDIIVSMADGAKHIDFIIERTGRSAGDILSILTMLELSGIISQQPGKIFSINKEFLKR